MTPRLVRRPVLALPPAVVRHPAAWHEARLEGSWLYQRRCAEARQTMQAARLAAIWRLSSDWRPRFER